MIDIEQCLRNIMAAVYGKDVRQSIHDAIYQMNTKADAAKADADDAKANSEAAKADAADAKTDAANAAKSAKDAVDGRDSAASYAAEAKNQADRATEIALKNVSAKIIPLDTGASKTIADKFTDIDNSVSDLAGRVSLVNSVLTFNSLQFIKTGSSYACFLDGSMFEEIKSNVKPGKLILTNQKAQTGSLDIETGDGSITFTMDAPPSDSYPFSGELILHTCGKIEQQQEDIFEP